MTSVAHQKIAECRDAWNALNAEAAKHDDSEPGKDRFYAAEQRWEKAHTSLMAMAVLASKGGLEGVNTETAKAALSFARNPDLRGLPAMSEMLVEIAFAARGLH